MFDWINIKHGLPENDGWYWCQFYNNFPEEGYAYQFCEWVEFKTSSFIDYKKDYPGYEIIAWKPKQDKG